LRLGILYFPEKSEICRQILRRQPKLLLLFDQNEFALYTIHSELLLLLNKLFTEERQLFTKIGSINNMENKAIKLLLLGKNGQIGFELQRSLAPLGELIALDRVECDLTDQYGMKLIIREHKPDVIVIAAAYTAVDKAETEEELAYTINRESTKIIGEEAARLGSLVIYYSTDYVFDGFKKSPYSENEIPNPLNVYGASKLAGETELQASGANHIIIRTSWVVGVHGKNFAKTILRLAVERNEISIVADQFGAPTSAALIADVTSHIIRQLDQSDTDKDLNHIYHLVADGKTNWHEYACHIIERTRKAGKPMKLSTEAVKAIEAIDYPLPAKRPVNSCLNNSKLRREFGLHLPDWRLGVDHILQQLLYND